MLVTPHVHVGKTRKKLAPSIRKSHFSWSGVRGQHNSCSVQHLLQTHIHQAQGAEPSTVHYKCTFGATLNLNLSFKTGSIVSENIIYLYD